MLAMQQVVLIVAVPVVVTCFYCPAAHAPHAQPAPAAAPTGWQQGRGRGAARRLLGAAAAAAVQAWDLTGRALIELCTGAGMDLLQLTVAFWMVWGVLWMVCKVNALGQVAVVKQGAGAAP